MENLGIDYKLIIAQIVNFGIFYVIFKKFISTPFIAALKKQKQDEHMREEMVKELENRQQKLEEENKKLSLERKKILDAALESSRSEAEVVKNEIIHAAKQQSEELMKKTHEQLEDERKKLVKDMRHQIVEVSTMVIEKAFKEYLTPDAQKQMTQKIISQIPDES